MNANAEGRSVTAFCGWFRVLALPLLFLLAACHPHAAPTPLPTPALNPVAALAARIDGALSDPALSRTTWGISIRSLARHEDLYELNAGRLLMPASTLKVVTLAVAAERLGWDFTFPTTLSYAGQVDAGVLHGDLIVVGSGDPTFDDWDGKGTAVFAEWASHLKAAGIGTVTGRVIGDDNVFDDNGLGAGWMWDDLAASYSAPVSGLQFNQNSAQIVISDPAEARMRPSLQLRPPSAPLVLINLLHAPPGTASLDLHLTQRGNAVEVNGIVPAGTKVTRNVAVPNPTLYFVNALKAALIENGIDIQGAASDIDDLEPGVFASAQARTVGDHRSPPLSSIAETMMHLSQNLFAETLLKTIGLAAAGPDTPAMPGTSAAGRTAEMATLASWGIAAEQMAIVDGSGLSRYNLVTPAALVSVLAHVYADQRLRDPFIRSLPVAGKTGTLEGRFAGTPAEGNVRAKTGSFSNARAVAGFVNTVDGEPLAFSIIANNYGVAAPVVDAATGRVLTALAEFSR